MKPRARRKAREWWIYVDSSGSISRWENPHASLIRVREVLRVRPRRTVEPKKRRTK